MDLGRSLCAALRLTLRNTNGFLILLSCVIRFLRSHNKQRELRGFKHAFSDTPHYPSLQATSSMRRHGDHIATEERELHTRLSLGDAVAHRRDPAGELRDRTGFRRGLLDNLGIFAQRLMRGFR